jgi:hypothetical protein
MGTGYYVTSFAMHGFAMFVPSLLFGSTHHKLVILLLFVSGPVMSEVLVWGGGQAVRRLEWPSIWCLFSVAQVRGGMCCYVLTLIARMLCYTYFPQKGSKKAINHLHSENSRELVASISPCSNVS